MTIIKLLVVNLKNMEGEMRQENKTPEEILRIINPMIIDCVMDCHKLLETGGIDLPLVTNPEQRKVLEKIKRRLQEIDSIKNNLE